MVRQGMRDMGVPLGTEQFQRDFLQKAVIGKPVELARALIPMENAQASFQMLRLSATSRLSHLLRTASPFIPCQAASNYGALVEWALVSIIAGEGTAAAGLSTPEEIAHDPTECQNQTKGTAYIGCHALVLGRAVAAFARGTFHPFLNGWLSNPWRQRSLKS